MTRVICATLSDAQTGCPFEGDPLKDHKLLEVTKSCFRSEYVLIIYFNVLKTICIKILLNFIYT